MGNPRIGRRYEQYVPLNGSPFNTKCFNGMYLSSRWLPTSTAYGFGAFNFGENPFNYFGGLIDTTAQQNTSGDYRLELRDKNGVFISHLLYWKNATWTDPVNEPGQLSFEYPAWESEADSFSYPNRVQLFRGTEYYPRRVFVIQKVKVIEKEDRWKRVECEGLLSLLAREKILDYNPGGTAETVTEILSNWLIDHQQLSPSINLGAIDTAIGSESIAVKFDKKSILQAIRDLHKIYGGYFRVTAGGRFTWKYQLGNDVGHVIRFGKNAAEITQELDYRMIETRLIGTATRFDGSSVEVTVNDAAAQSTYDIITGFYKSPIDVANDATGTATLTTLTTNELARRSGPKESFLIGAIDLSFTDRYDYNWEAGAMDPGSRIRIIANDGNTDIEAAVYKVIRTLDNPLAVRIYPVDISGGVGVSVSYERKADFIDALGGVIRYVQEQQTA